MALFASTWFAPQHTGAQTATNPPMLGDSVGGVSLRVLNREVFVFRSSIGHYEPEQRAAAAAVLIEHALPKSGKAAVTSQPNGTNVEIQVNGKTVLTIAPGDAEELLGETLDTLVRRTVNRLDLVLAEQAELRDRRGLLMAALTGTGSTVVLVGFIWLLVRNRRWVEGRLIRLTADKADQLKSHTLRTVGLQNVVPLLRGLSTALFWVVVALATYLWIEYVLQLFPLTRPFGEQLSARFLKLLGSFGQSVMRSIPNLGIVFLVLVSARFVSTAARRFFAAVARGKVKSRIFDPSTAPITQRLCVFMIWVTAVIVAFPYIPGSQTPAFRGISVMAGLMISLGSANLIAQLVGGLIVVYNRTCRPGDYIRVGDHEGTLASIGFFSSRLVTIRNEEVVVPNSQFSSGVLINYSRLSETGVALPVNISIGYNTPWRQVHAMLMEAARRTSGVRQQPAPGVLQSTLGDFYIEYQLNATLEKPNERLQVLSDLNAHIQDVFNEHGVQIMSPHYLSDPAKPVLVPKEQWHQPPAKSDSPTSQTQSRGG